MRRKKYKIVKWLDEYENEIKHSHVYKEDFDKFEKIICITEESLSDNKYLSSLFDEYYLDNFQYNDNKLSKILNYLKIIKEHNSLKS